jgi:trehalose 6-phosphate phosphatase
MLDALTDDPGRSALLLDYDGSLAPIVLMPQDAVPLPGTAGVLSELGAHLGVVAVVSGRPVDFLAEHLPSANVQLHGQYGLERVESGIVFVDERALPYVDAVATAADEVAGRWPQIYIERKGDIAVAFHWRAAGDVDASVVDEIEALGHRLGLSVNDSKMAREFRPPVDIDKGTIASALIDRMTTAVFAGDDAGDLPAFAALEAAKRAGHVERAFRVAVSSSEAPPEVLRNADVVVDGPQGLRQWLDLLVEALRAGSKPASGDH